MSTGKLLNLEELRKMLEDYVAIRGRATLVPAGGPGDKVFPPTHQVDEKYKEPGAKYAFESRRIDGQEVKCVLLDSVQSQANRMEEALQELWERKLISLPVIQVDLTSCAPEVGTVTSLTAPHRIADALLRDSMIEDGTLFRLSNLGRSFTDASLRNAEPLFRVCPTGLIFGLWDSTGPKGGLGAKFARAVVSEIIGIRANAGVKTSSRIDPAGIIKIAAEVYDPKDPNEIWTIDPGKAKLDEKTKKPKKKGDGRVTEVNHSNIPPTVDVLAGGVTIDHAIHSVVLSLSSLRRLQFPNGALEARSVLASLALLAILASVDRGYDLRSRCLLVPRKDEEFRLEAVRKDGRAESVHLELKEAIQLYHQSLQTLPEPLKFTTKPGEPLAILKPTPKLEYLIRKSRELAAAGAVTEDE